MSNDELLGIMEQLILLSAFLGGFSATFLATILTIDPTTSKKIVNWIIIASALAACCFIVCATSSIAVVNGINSIDGENLYESLKTIRVISILSMLLGVFSLIGCIGMSGWLRGKLVGIVTSSIAVVAVLIVAALA